MGVIITLVVIGLVVFFFVRNSRAGAAVSAVRQVQARVRDGADRTETFQELIAEFDGKSDVGSAVRAALRVAAERMPDERVAAALAEAAAIARTPAELPIPRKSKKQNKTLADTSDRPHRFGHGPIDPLQPLAAYDARPPAPALKKRRPLPAANPLEPINVPAAYAARS